MVFVFDIKIFYPRKLILKFFGGHFEFFGGHFEFFGGHFEFFFVDSLSTHKVVETKWSSFFHKLLRSGPGAVLAGLQHHAIGN